MIQTDDFDAIISDHDMPGMSGPEMIAKIREFDEKIIIILTSAGCMESELEEIAMHCGANRGIPKAHNTVEELVALVEILIARQCSGP
jgi:CheY-like chemotaxis protein